MRKPRSLIEKATRSVKARVIHVKDSPHRIALGVAIGFFVAFSPAIGSHIIIALALSFMLRANKLAAMLAIWINNPLTLVPMLYLGYVAGGMITSLFGAQVTTASEFHAILTSFQSSSEFTSFYHLDFWKQLFDLFWRVGLELWIGGTILGILAAVGGYFLTLRVICWYRKKYPRRRYLAWQ